MNFCEHISKICKQNVIERSVTVEGISGNMLHITNKFFIYYLHIHTMYCIYLKKDM